MPTSRRGFLAQTGAGLGAAVLPSTGQAAQGDLPGAVDFRYAPLCGQAAFCFPDDPYKSLISTRGELLYQNHGTEFFGVVVDFSLKGMEGDQVAEQRLEAPEVPIINTRLDRPEASLELTTFATNRAGEGRVDNVILEVRPRSQKSIHAVPLVNIRTRQNVESKFQNGRTIVTVDGAVVLVVEGQAGTQEWVWGLQLHLPEKAASGDHPMRAFVRLPQQGQAAGSLALGDPEGLLEEARAFWHNWQPYGGKVGWQLPGPYNDFLLSCARNILQAREQKKGRLTFQVGPTVYRGLWVVDGNFILEAARYLGYDKEAQEGLETTWSYQQPDGSVQAGGGREHWKDTAIAMFTLVRQAELSQDWSYFRQMVPQVLKGVQFLNGLREQAVKDGGLLGQYGLLAKGFPDGGLGGLRSEFTNTIWVLAGLKAVSEAARVLDIAALQPAAKLHSELQAAFSAAAAKEMRRHPGGFDYLHMLLADDPQWKAATDWERPRPQAAQWALSHAIYPGVVFEPGDPVVKGHLQLMQSCVQEDIPAETGWLPHQGLWNYNAGFVSHVYLWAQMPDWARLTFLGFLNHATPLLCWREEQPVRGALVSHYVGDMPHNWASAECVLYLRHMLALEAGQQLRLLSGLGGADLQTRRGYRLSQSPTRFGRIDLSLEPAHGGWQLDFRRGAGPKPGTISLPAALGRYRLAEVSGAHRRLVGDKILVEPEASAWSAFWK